MAEGVKPLVSACGASCCSVSHIIGTSQLVESAVGRIDDRNHPDWLFSLANHFKQRETEKKGKAPRACRCSIHDVTHLVRYLRFFSLHLLTSDIHNFLSEVLH